MTVTISYASAFEALQIDPDVLRALSRSEHHSPHDILGAHPVIVEGQQGVVVRGFHPDASACELVWGDEIIAMQSAGSGVFVTYLSGQTLPIDYRLRFAFSD